jgi:hypothetical protein
VPDAATSVWCKFIHHMNAKQLRKQNSVERYGAAEESPAPYWDRFMGSASPKNAPTQHQRLITTDLHRFAQSGHH